MLPFLQTLLRWAVYLRNEARVIAFAVHPRLLDLYRVVGERHIARGIDDPQLRARVTPRFTPGCKRILLDDEYYPALARDNVTLVTDAVTGLTATGVVDASGATHDADVVVYSTGFSLADYLAPLRVVGAAGRVLNDAWQKGAEAYLGTMVSGFPNLFTLVGPNTGLGHSSMVFMIEAQVGLVMRVLARQRARGSRAVDVHADAQSAFNRALRRRLQNTVWASGCKSWYLDADGENRTLWPGFTFEFWWRARRVRWADLNFHDDNAPPARAVPEESDHALPQPT